jgi:hypothetical protein
MLMTRVISRTGRTQRTGGADEEDVEQRVTEMGKKGNRKARRQREKAAV